MNYSLRGAPRALLSGLFVLVMVTLSAACGGGGGGDVFVPPPAAPIQPLSDDDRLYFDAQGGITDSLDIVVRSQGEYQEQWRTVTANRRRPPAAAFVDFTRNMVVIAAAGPVPGQSRIRIDSTAIVTERDARNNMTDVFVVWETLSRACSPASRAEDHPVALARVPRFESTVRFVRTEEPGPGC